VDESFRLGINLPGGGRRDATLEECLDAWKQQELQYMTCCPNPRGIEQNQLMQSANLLLMQLGRFNLLGDEKVHTPIGIPQNLEFEVGGRQRQYRLIGIVYHRGESRASGHYFTWVYHDLDRVWLDANDRAVTPTVLPDRIWSSHAYLLLYQQI